MDLIKQLLPILATLSLAATVMVVGMTAAPGDLLHVLRRPGLLARALLSVNIIVPASAIAVAALLPLAPVVKAGLILMAVSPVPPLIAGKARKAGGSQAYVDGLYVALVLLSVVVVPLSVAVLDALYPAKVFLPLLGVAKTMTLGVVLPLGLGVAIGRLAPAPARRAAPVVAKIGMGLLLLVAIAVIAKAWPVMITLVGDGAFLAMVVVTAIALLAGHMLGPPDAGDRAALALTSATRHPGIALMIANASFQDARISGAILLFLVAGIITAAPYQVWVKHRSTAPATA